MALTALISLASFAFVASFTPGPNNLLLMASGANFGVPRSVPHMMGVVLGFALMMLLVGAGLVGVFAAVPGSYLALKVLSAAYLLYLAWKIATAASVGDAADAARPFTFLQAAGFQWVNPKAWAVALSTASIYAPSSTLGAVSVIALVYLTVSVPCVLTWTYLGQQIKRVLRKTAALRAFNVVMALLLVASLIPMLRADLG